ncbi:addiction module toxin RelE [Fusobacterium polymorphum]|uniref:addiction module toxin RelE n=1 Tax=Fusobacterium nucleatum subsp. polymorphum TaxID=76857 RepID=UPI003863C877
MCENEKKAIKKYNKIIAEKLIFSIEFLKNSKSLKDVADYNNFRLHELKYERKGQFAIDLGKTTGYRLIIEPITVNEKNEVISYESINIVEIMEVSNHYE